MTKICVFLASAEPYNDTIAQAIISLARTLAHNGHHLIMGGMDTGAMKLLGDTFLATGGKATIIYPVEYAEWSATCTHPDVEHVTTANVNERLGKMLELADAFITLPGGMGTLHELHTVLADNQACLYHTGGFRKLKPMVIYNQNYYFDATCFQLLEGMENNYIKLDHRRLVQMIEKSEELLPQLELLLTLPFEQWPMEQLT